MSVKTLGSKIVSGVNKVTNFIVEEITHYIAPCLLTIIVFWIGLVIFYSGSLIARDNGWLTTAEQIETYNNLISYVEDKDIESIEYLKEEHKNYTKTVGITIKVVGEEPQTFKDLNFFKNASHDDKIHISGENYNVIIYEPVDYTTKYISN